MRKKFFIKLVSLAGLLLSSCSFKFPFIDKIFGPSVESVRVTNKISEIEVKETYQFDAEVLPSDARSNMVTWKSSNEDVVSISDNGSISALKIGSTTIEAISKSNTKIKDSFELKVIEPTLNSISVKYEPDKVFYYVGETFEPAGLVIDANYTNATNKLIPYNGNEGDFTFIPSLDKPLTILDHTILLTYKDKRTSFEIEIDLPDSISKTHLAYTYDDYMENNIFGNMDNCPLEGNPKLLIIPIWFNDSDTFIDTSKKADIRNDIEKAYIGEPSDTGWHSVKSYYHTESFGKLTLNATVTDWYNVGTSYTNYAPEANSGNTAWLVYNASSDYFTNHPLDSRTNYDTNNDGYLDGVILIYAAPDYDSLGNESYKNLWAYCSWLGTTSDTSAPITNVYFWASYDFLYGSNALEKTGSSYARGYTENGVTIDTHCLIHEMGHVLGAPDYYDYSKQYNPAGGFSMQDFNVGGHDPYSVIAYGWADPYIPTKSMTISIGDFQSTHDVILLANHSVSDSPFDEYLLLEYYTPTGLNKLDSDHSYRGGYPQGPSVGGIRLWHVDARLFSHYPNETTFTTNPTDGEVYHAMSNSYSDDSSYLGADYKNYNILQLIRNDSEATYTPLDNLSSETLFKAGDSFNMSTYSSQFVKGPKMNNNKSLGWSFTVDSISSSSATITLTKL